jgi:Glyoxalase-like domain
VRVGAVVVDCNDFASMLAIGATRHPREPEAGDDFVVLEDPEGNLFCVVDLRRLGLYHREPRSQVAALERSRAIAPQFPRWEDDAALDCRP